MRSHYRYALGFGLVVGLASCGQILDADAPYVLSSGAGAGGMGMSASVAESSSSSGAGGAAGAGGMGGALIGVCSDGKQSGEEECDDGNKVDGDACDSNCTPTVCGNGIVVPGEQCDDGNNVNNDGCGTDCRITPNSCLGLPETCGPQQNENCCNSIPIVGGTFNRSNDSQYPATVSSFRLDRFEVTVGRFRKFVEAYPANKPAVDAGAHPLIPQSGWKSAWNMLLPPDQMTLRSALKNCGAHPTWTDSVGAQESLPSNCVNWHEA